MISGIITAFLAFMQAVPAITGGINNFVNKYYDAKVQLVTARVGGDAEMAKALVAGVVDEKKVSVSFLHEVANSKFLMFLIGGFALPIMIWFGKCVVWDTVLGLGSTPPLYGQVATMANIVVGGIFGVGGVSMLTTVFSQWRKSNG